MVSLSRPTRLLTAPFCGLLALVGLSGLVLGGCSSSSSTEAPDAGIKKDTGSGFDGYIALPPHVDAGTDAHDATAPRDTGHDVGTPVPEAAPPPPPPTDAMANTFPAFVPGTAAPQVLDFGGPVLTNPNFVPILFAGDQYASDIPTFLNAVGPSDYWKEAVSEYAVGPATASPPITLDETMPPSIDDSQLQIWLQNRIGSDPRFGAFPDAGGGSGGVVDAGHSDGGHHDGGHEDASHHDASRGVDASIEVTLDANAPLSDALAPNAIAPEQDIYVIFLPESTKVTLDGATSCVNFGGYHSYTTYGPNGTSIVYAVIPRCSSGLFGLAGIDAVTGPLSHELAEASTDPLISAYADIDEESFLYWEVVLGGGEVGDMCAQFPNAFFNPSEAALSNYTVQRIWSNAHAAAGHDPCRPALPTTQEPFYFNSIPQLSPVSVLLNTQGGQESVPELGIVAPPNVPTTVQFKLFSDAPDTVGPWTVSAFSASTMYYSSAKPDLTFVPTLAKGSNGYTVNLTVTNLSNDGMSAHPFIVSSQLGELQNWWIGVVVDEAAAQ